MKKNNNTHRLDNNFTKKVMHEVMNEWQNQLVTKPIKRKRNIFYYLVSAVTLTIIIGFIYIDFSYIKYTKELKENNITTSQKASYFSYFKIVSKKILF